MFAPFGRRVGSHRPDVRQFGPVVRRQGWPCDAPVFIYIICPEVARFHPEVARFHPEVARFHPEVARFHMEVPRFYPEVARFHPEVATFHAEVQRFRFAGIIF